MIVGIGTDIIKIDRIAKSIDKYGYKLIQRIYSEKEIDNSKKYKDNRSLYSYYAKRWAAKEAFAKAIGIGIRIGINLKDISILNDSLGKPYIELSNKLHNLINNLHPSYNIHLSISDDYPIAIAFVMIEK